MKTISLTVPMDYNALTRASDMLHGLAVDLSKEGAEPLAPAPVATVTETAHPAPAPVVEEAQLDAARVFTDLNPAAPATAGVDTAPAYTNPAVLVPWDVRIHSGTPTKLAKTPHNWKKKRGVDDALVAQVEAELIQAMEASPVNPVEPAPMAETASPAPAPVEVETAAQPDQPAAQPAATGGVTTFPGLMTAITSKAIDPATVLAAVNKQGLQALPLLAARPDLIPAVAAELEV